MSQVLDVDRRRRERYSQGGGVFRIIPAAVAQPRDPDQLRQVVAAAAHAALPLTPRGAGSAMDGGNVGAGVVVDMSRFDAGRCEIDAEARTATISPSLSLADLNRLAAPSGLHFPVDPSSAAWATLGGMLSTNAAGARTVRDGDTGSWVEAVTLETSDGSLRLDRRSEPDQDHPVIRRWQREAEPVLRHHREAILARWPATRKNAFGYRLDRWYASGYLLDLIAGSEGTLGAVMEMVVRLAPIASVSATLKVTLADRDALVPVMALLDRERAVRIEFFDRSFLRIAGEAADAAAMIIADFEGDDLERVSATVGRCAVEVAAIAGRSAMIDTASGEWAAALWQVRHGVSSRLAGLTDGRRSLQVVEDGCVPADRLVDYIAGLEAICAARGIEVVMFGHAGDGHVHANLLVDPTVPDWLADVRAILDQASGLVLALGGTPAGEHGIGRIRAHLVERFLGPEGLAAFRAVRRAFDPAGLWNPGVIVPDGAEPLTQLKLGEGAAAVPVEVASRLHRIEVERLWGDDRWEG